MQKELKKDFSTLKTIDEHSKFLQQKINEKINQGPFRNSIDKTRSFLFYTYELPEASEVKNIPDYAEKTATVIVPNSYLIRVAEHEYSVPYTYIKKPVDVFVTNDYVIFKFEGKEVARHLRNDSEGMTRVNATPKCPIFDIRKCHSTLKILISENVNLDSRGKEINPQVISFL